MRLSKISYSVAVFIGAILCLLLNACTAEPYFSKSIEFEASTWADGSQISFEFPIQDTTGIYDMNLVVEIDKEKYPFQNLYVKITTTFPSGESQNQVLSLNLFSRIGYAEGPCRGEICKIPITIQQNIFFPEYGQYKLDLLPWMRIDTIPGLHAMHLEIIEADG